MRRLVTAGAVLALGVVALVAIARPGEGGPAARPLALGIGRELMQALPQQVPGQEPIVDRGMFDDPRGPQVEYEETWRTAGRFPFYWTRAVYTSGGFGRRGGGGDRWAVDFPKSDQQFLIVIKRLMNLKAYDWENPVYLADPVLRKFPMVYMLEVGGMNLREDEIEGLRGYMDAGGFVVVDDFWGQDQWDVFEFNMRRVYPDKQFVDLTLDHPLYSAYYKIDHVEMTPAIGNEIQRTECYGCYTQVKGMYDDQGRLMMVVNFNTDLGDAWEHAENPRYPLETSTYAFEMGANLIAYAMSH
jgi:hypothetical protein